MVFAAGRGRRQECCLQRDAARPVQACEARSQHGSITSVSGRLTSHAKHGPAAMEDLGLLVAGQVGGDRGQPARQAAKATVSGCNCSLNLTRQRLRSRAVQLQLQHSVGKIGARSAAATVVDVL